MNHYRPNDRNEQGHTTANKSPDYTVTVITPDGERRGGIGNCWVDPDGSIRMYLSPGTLLEWDAPYAVCLFVAGDTSAQEPGGMHGTPDYVVAATTFDGSHKGSIGAGWAGSDGSIRLRLNPGVILEWDAPYSIRLFVNRKKAYVGSSRANGAVT